MDEIKNKICKEILLLFKQILGSAINQKSGTNLLNTHLDKDANTSFEGNEIFKLMYNDYLQYIESGRKPFARKVPVRALIPWARERGIPTDNNTIYAIRESIYKTGIKPRLIIEPLEMLLDDRFDKQWSDEIFEAIIKELDKIFNK